ncbi:MAG: putative WD-40 repeat family protein [Streblomastix strix]|uniref:Putative WD-40 repeat family protein n=1 Tax=Streblomastix strix TaxID=222440 RepID=A0A5J4X273_9EUKA|nr:MAG: putative WD-40 repeat family protein [Streblomastix strix]
MKRNYIDTPIRNTCSVKRHEGIVTSIKFSSDGSFLASSGNDASLCIYDGRTAQFMFELQDIPDAHKQAISDFSISSDGRYICTASEDRTSKLYDLCEGSVIRTLRGNRNGLQGHASGLMSCDLSASGGLCLTGGADSCVCMWDVLREICLAKIHSSELPVTAVEFGGSGCSGKTSENFLTAGFDGFCRVWDSNTLQCTHTLLEPTSPSPIGGCIFSPDSRTILTANLDGSLRLWDPFGSGRCIKMFFGHSNRNYCLRPAFMPASCSDANQKDLDHWMKIGENNNNNNNNSYDMVNKENPIEYNRYNELSEPLTCMNTFVACGSEDGSICLWDLRSQMLTTRLNAHKAPVNSLAMHPHRRILASSSYDGCVKLWEHSDRCLCMINETTTETQSEQQRQTTYDHSIDNTLNISQQDVIQSSSLKSEPNNCKCVLMHVPLSVTGTFIDNFTFRRQRSRVNEDEWILAKRLRKAQNEIHAQNLSDIRFNQKHDESLIERSESDIIEQQQFQNSEQYQELKQQQEQLQKEKEHFTLREHLRAVEKKRNLILQHKWIRDQRIQEQNVYKLKTAKVKVQLPRITKPKPRATKVAQQQRAKHRQQSNINTGFTPQPTSQGDNIARLGKGKTQQNYFTPQNNIQSTNLAYTNQGIQLQNAQKVIGTGGLSSQVGISSLSLNLKNKKKKTPKKSVGRKAQGRKRIDTNALTPYNVDQFQLYPGEQEMFNSYGDIQNPTNEDDNESKKLIKDEIIDNDYLDDLFSQEEDDPPVASPLVQETTPPIIIIHLLQQLLSGEEDNNVEPLYEPIDASFVHDIKQNDFHKNYISSLNYLPLQNVFITTGTDGLAKIWSGDLSTSQVICTIDHVQSLQTQATRGEVDIIEQIKANDDEERAKNIRSQIGINSDQYQNASISINSSKQQNDKNISESIPKQKSQQSNIAMHLGRPRPGQNISQTVEKEQTQEDTKDKTQKNLTFENYRLKKASQTKDNRMANYANAIKGAFDMKDHAILYKLYADTPATSNTILKKFFSPGVNISHSKKYSLPTFE